MLAENPEYSSINEINSAGEMGNNSQPIATERTYSPRYLQILDDKMKSNAAVRN